MQGFKDQIRKKFNVSVAEVERHDLWQRIDLAAAMVATNTVYIDQVFTQIMKLIAHQADLEIVDESREWV